MKNKKYFLGKEVSLEEVEKELGKQETWGKALEEVERYNMSWQNSSEKNNLEGMVQNKPPTDPERQVLREEQYTEGIWHRYEHQFMRTSTDVTLWFSKPAWYRYELVEEEWDSTYVGDEPSFLKLPTYEQVAQKLATFRCFVEDRAEYISQEDLLELQELETVLEDVEKFGNQQDHRSRMLRANLMGYLVRATQWDQRETQYKHEQLLRKDLLGIITPKEKEELRDISEWLADQSH